GLRIASVPGVQTCAIPISDHVVCTLPFSVLAHVDVAPPFSPQKARAVAELPYTSVARVYLQFRRKAWAAENLPVTATTDLPIKRSEERRVGRDGVWRERRG